MYALLALLRAQLFEGPRLHPLRVPVGDPPHARRVGALVGPRIDLPEPRRRRWPRSAASWRSRARARVERPAAHRGPGAVPRGRAAMTRAAVTVGLERPLPASTDPDRTLVLVPSPVSLRADRGRATAHRSATRPPGAVEPIPPDVLAEARVARGRQARTCSAPAGGLEPGRMPPQPADERDPVPVQVVRQPLAELEVALAGGPVAPRRRDLGDPSAGQRRLDGELEGELEAGGALDRHRVEEPARVELEVVRRVVGRDAREPVEGQARRSGSSGA